MPELGVGENAYAPRPTVGPPDIVRIGETGYGYETADIPTGG